MRLVFDETQGDLAGFEITLRRLSIGQLRTLSSVSESLKEDADFGPVLGVLADRAVSWNLEDEDGVPVPLTRQAMDELDVAMVFGLVRAWMERAVNIPLPLSQPSGDGETFPEGSIPMMELPLPSLAN